MVDQIEISDERARVIVNNRDTRKDEKPVRKYFVERSGDEVIEILKQAATGRCNILVDGNKMFLSSVGPVAMFAPETIAIKIESVPSGSIATIADTEKKVSYLFIYFIVFGVGSLMLWCYFSLRNISLVWNQTNILQCAVFIIGILSFGIIFDKDKSRQRTQLIQCVETSLAKQAGFKSLDEN